MSQAPRWQRAVPRLLLVVVALLAAQYALGLVARSLAVRSGEAMLKARIEVDHARVAVVDRQLVLSHMRLADPRQPDKCALEADRCEFDIAARPLLHKQAVIDRGRISGLRIGALHKADCDNSQGVSAPAADWFGSDSDAAAEQWLARLSERFAKDLSNRLDSVQRAEALCALWEKQSAEMLTRGQELERRTSELQQAVDVSQANPLRNDKPDNDLPAKIAALQKEFSQFHADCEKLPDALDAERRAVVAARRQDEELLRVRFEFEPIDADALTVYLLREPVVKPLEELVGWLRWTRQVAPQGANPQRKPGRGEEILFAGCRPQPELLIRSLQLQGNTRIGGRPVELSGTIADVTTLPAQHSQPIRLRLTGSGSLALELQATIDRTAPVARDEVYANCRGIALPQLVFGRADEFHLTLAPSVASLTLSVTVDGERLTGDIQMVQQQVRMTPALRGRLSEVPLAPALESSLEKVQSLATRLTLGGTLGDPKCSLWSNLGAVVAVALERSHQRERDDHVRAVLVEAQRRVDERLASLERQVTERQTRLATLVNDVSGRLSSLASGVAPRYRVTPEQLGRRLPVNSLFR